MKRKTTGRERVLVEVGVGWGMYTCGYTWLNFSAETTRTQVVLADRPRGRSGHSKKQSQLTSWFCTKLLSLLHSSKLIFQAFKNHANFCVDTRNQEQPIVLRIGRKAIVDLK